MNLDPSDLHIETDDAGFIIGQSVIGDSIGSESSSWMERKGQIHALSMVRSVTVNNAVQFEPSAMSLSVVMAHDALRNGAFGKRLRVRWKNQVLFVGQVKTVDANYSISGNKAKAAVKIQALGVAERFSKIKLDSFERPEETAGVRAASTIVSSDFQIFTINCNRLMAARGESDVMMMTVLKETANTQLARFYIDINNNLVLDGNPSPQPVVFFSDDPNAPGRTNYNSVAMRQDVDNVVTAITVNSKQSLKDAEGNDYQLSSRARDTSAVVTHEQIYEADVPLRQNQVDAWAQSFPLLGYTHMEPTTLKCQWQDELANLELTHLVSIQKDGRTYRSGVKAIKYDLRAEQDGMKWTVTLDLMPGHLVQYTPVIAPSDPRAFSAVAITDHRIDLTWQAPEAPNGLTGYEIRYNAGPTAPMTRTQGASLVTLPAGAVSYSHTGIPSATQHSYTIWATTSNAALSSQPVTAGASTPETIPSAVQGLTAAKNSTTVHTLSWTAPSAPGTDIDHYMIRGNSTAEPTATGDFLFARVPLGTTSWTNNADQLGRNQTLNWAVWPVTKKGAVGPVARTTQNTNEVIPSAVGNIFLVADNYQTIRGGWTHSANRQDWEHYRVVRLENAYRAPGVNEHPQYGVTGEGIYLQPVSMNTHHDIAVYPITKGGLVGPMANAWTDTPQGIFSHTYDMECSWAQSYKANGNPAAFGSGSPQNLYYGYVESTNGNLRSMVGWNTPANVQNCYSVDRVIMRFYNLHTYNNSGADCDFGVHTWDGPPGTFPGGATGLARYRMNKPGWLDVDITSWAAGHFRGGARGFFLGPAPSNSTAYYGYASGTAGNGPRPQLRIEYRTIG